MRTKEQQITKQVMTACLTVIFKRMETKFNMGKVKVFLSFEFDRDEELHRNFYAQAARGDSCHEIEDYSLQEAYQPHDNSWLKKARLQISRSDIVIVVIGTIHIMPLVLKKR